MCLVGEQGAVSGFMSCLVVFLCLASCLLFHFSLSVSLLVSLDDVLLTRFGRSMIRLINEYGLGGAC